MQDGNGIALDKIDKLTKNGKVAIPSWVVTLIVVIVLNALTIAFSAGVVSSRLSALEARFVTLESRFNSYIDRQAEQK